MSYREHAPHPALAPYVDRLWWGAAPAGAPPVHILPDGCLDVIVDLAGPGGPTARVIGAMTRAVVVAAREPARIVAVRFRPGAAAAFLRVDADRLTDATAPLSALGAPWLRPDAVAAARDLPTAARRLERALLARLAYADALDPRVTHAVARLAGPAAPTIAALGADLGWSRQHLARTLSAAVGVSPKLLARIARLQRAVIGLADPFLAIADVAVAVGYYDQAHLARDLRQLAGVTPAAARAGSIRPIRSLYGAA